MVVFDNLENISCAIPAEWQTGWEIIWNKNIKTDALVSKDAETSSAW